VDRPGWDKNRPSASRWMSQQTARPDILAPLRDPEQAWEYFRRTDLHNLSTVDSTSLAIMKYPRIPLACAFDHHFVVAGFIRYHMQL
jgi:hypothetical protein